jgi:hypothetical protein
MLGFMGVAISMLDDLESLKNMLRQAGHRHAGYGALSSYYPALGEALLLTLEGALGSKFTPDTRQAWSEFYDFMSECMAQSTPHADKQAATSTQMALHLEDLLEDPGPQSAHVPLLASTVQEVPHMLYGDASQARDQQTGIGQLHLHRARLI